MALILGSEFLIVLTRSEDLAGHVVAIVNSVDEAIATWDWSTRTSPIFSLNNAPAPNVSSDQLNDFYFIGPVSPKDIPQSIPSYLTFGTYNVLFVSENKKHERTIQEFLTSNPELPWETWEIKAGRIRSWKCSNRLRRTASRPQIKTSKVRSLGLRSAQEENATLLAASIAKAERYFPENAKELEKFRSAFNAVIAANQENHEITKLSLLVNVNAILSRYTSQTFSGTSPILETECHFWTHSLLGVGIATEALTKFRRFIEKATELHDPIRRLESFKQISAFKDISLIGIPTTYHEYWEEISTLIVAARQDPAKKSRGRNGQRVPLVVCFSGRDGFRSTIFSLSAPLEVISCCNTYGWTPMTLTHEICHVWVSGILGKFFPKLNDRTGLAELEQIHTPEYIPKNLFEQAQQLLFFCFTILYREEIGAMTSDEIPKDKQRTFFQIINSQTLAVNELLTHILDFQFFYQGDEKLYVSSVWSSWDVIPNIKDRLSEYIVRTACALLSNNLNKKDAINLSLDRLSTLLKQVEESLPNGQYLKEAQGLLEVNRKSFYAKVRARRHLVRLAFTFFPNHDLVTLLQRERPETGGAYSSMKAKKFESGESIRNPLLFVSKFSRDRVIDRAKSLWMLQHIAFVDYDKFDT